MRAIISRVRLERNRLIPTDTEGFRVVSVLHTETTLARACACSVWWQLVGKRAVPELVCPGFVLFCFGLDLDHLPEGRWSRSQSKDGKTQNKILLVLPQTRYFYSYQYLAPVVRWSWCLPSGHLWHDCTALCPLTSSPCPTPSPCSGFRVDLDLACHWGVLFREHPNTRNHCDVL